MTRPPRKPTAAVKRLTLAMVMQEHEAAAWEARVVQLVQEGMAVKAAERRATAELIRQGRVG